jgi:hypothetical protein
MAFHLLQQPHDSIERKQKAKTARGTASSFAQLKKNFATKQKCSETLKKREREQQNQSTRMKLVIASTLLESCVIKK